MSINGTLDITEDCSLYGAGDYMSIFSENVPKKYFNMVLSCEDCMLLEMNHNYLTSKDV